MPRLITHPKLAGWAKNGCIGCWNIGSRASTVLHDVSRRRNDLIESTVDPAVDVNPTAYGWSVRNGVGGTVNYGWQTTRPIEAGSGCTLVLITYGRGGNLSYQLCWWGSGPDYFIATAGGAAYRWRCGGVSLYSAGGVILSDEINVVVATHDAASGRAQMWHNGVVLLDTTASYTPSGSSRIALGALADQTNSSETDEYLSAFAMDHAIPSELGMKLSLDPNLVYRREYDRYAPALMDGASDHLVIPHWAHHQPLIGAVA